MVLSLPLGSEVGWHNDNQRPHQAAVRVHVVGQRLLVVDAPGTLAKLTALNERVGLPLPALGAVGPLLDAGSGFAADRLGLLIGGGVGGRHRGRDQRLQHGHAGQIVGVDVG